MFHQNNIVLIGSSVAEQSKSIKHLNKRVINIDYFNDEDLKVKIIEIQIILDL